MFEHCKRIGNFIKNVFSRTFFLYCALGIVLFSCVDMERAWSHVVTTTLSRYMPPYDYLIAFHYDRKKFDLKKTQEFERYYRKVSQFMPFLAEAHGLLGFCYFYDGQISKSEKAYQAATRAYAKVFNFHYNLAIISLGKNDHRKALEHFKNSVDVSPIENIQYIVNARVYKPFLPFAKQPNLLAAAMGEYTHDVYWRGYLQIFAICEELKDYSTMLFYARQAIVSGFSKQGIGHYYAGRALYELKEYKSGAWYLHEAINQGFDYAQVYQMMGLCLKALGRAEGDSAFIVAARLNSKGKIFLTEGLKTELLVY
jgi:tetratricopeptide (TPR) repeat protein